MGATIITNEVKLKLINSKKKKKRNDLNFGTWNVFKTVI